MNSPETSTFHYSPKICLHICLSFTLILHCGALKSVINICLFFQPVTCPSDLVAMASQRQGKIQRYRQKKELEAKLSDIRRAIDSGQADDEVMRDFYLLNIRRWVTVCLEEVESIDQEMEILKKMDVLKQSETRPPAHPPRPPMKPFILTKDAVQVRPKQNYDKLLLYFSDLCRKQLWSCSGCSFLIRHLFVSQAQVFGAGYPSLPTMTVDDWYEQHKKHGVLPDQGIPRSVAVEEDTDSKDREEEEKERKAEMDDENSLLKARNWDDWKDTHHRGYGNRHNMG